MSYMHEMMRFHSNLGVKMYLKLEVFPCWLYIYSGGPNPIIYTNISPPDTSQK